MIDSTLSPSDTTSDTVCNMTQPHHHHRHHHHLPQPQIIYVVANPQDLPIKAYPQNWPPIPAVAASMNQVNVSSNYHTLAPAPAPAPAPATPATVHTPSTPKDAQTQASSACTTIVDDCCVDCCPAAAAEETKQPSQPACCSSPSEHHRPLPLPYAIRPAVSHHFQALRPIAPYPIPATPPSSATPVASAISDFHRQHNVFSHQTPRLNTPQTQHGQRQQLGPRSVSAPTSPTRSTTNDPLSMTAPLMTQRRDQAEPTENESTSVDQPDVALEDSLQTEFEPDASESVASSLATLSEAAVAASADKETWAAGHKRKLDEQQGEARCLWAACAAVFKCIDDLIPHLTKLHVASRSIKATNQCRWETCQTEKEDSDELISHLCEEHLGAPELKHGCHWQGCDTRFESFDDLTGHLSERHIGTGKSQYFCSWDECERQGRAFTQRQKVMRHIQTHTGDKPYQCNVCNKRFSEANIMTQHMRRHTGEKPYRCPETGCAKEFSISGALTIHKRVHSGEKPFRCKFEGCDRRFAESSNLTKHTRVHTGERPFKCTLPSCDRRFSRPDQLTRHEKTHKVKS